MTDVKSMQIVFISQHFKCQSLAVSRQSVS